ncbi:cation channel complex component UNC80 domain-containing protein [Ditylenchus destructor]|nr:cation channel complex component UNC80 domain-containing protein [Ditylenchus destructor]
MHVKYLQHQQFGTVQLLMMPVNSGTKPSQGSSFKSAKWSDKPEEEDVSGECEPLPLPVQSFLWRQISPFIGAKTGRLHEASCVTFERVVVQNILHGLSPSLSDAIASISRWRLVKAAFPHIVQCGGSLLTERASEDETIAMSGPLVKILYILHWLLLDAVIECHDEAALNGSGNGGSTLNVRQLTYPISSIQLFVYLLAPLFNTIKEEDIQGHIRLESGLRIWQALWQNRSPDVLCFCAPVKQRRNTHLAPHSSWSGAPWQRKLPSTSAAEQGIYLGEEPTPPLPQISSAGFSTARRFSRLAATASSPTQKVSTSTVIPPPKPPRTDIMVLKDLEKQQERPDDNETEDGDNTTSRQTTATEFTGASSTSSITGSIVRSVSDYKTNELANAERECQRAKLTSIRKSKTDTFYHTQDSDTYHSIKIMDESMQIAAAEDGSSSSFNSDIFQVGDKAPLACLQDICSAASIDNSIDRVSEQNGSSVLNLEQKVQRDYVPIIRTTAERLSVKESKTPRALESPVLAIKSPSADDSSSVASQQTIITRPILATKPPQPPKSIIVPIPDLGANVGKDSASIGSDKGVEMVIDHDPNEGSRHNIDYLTWSDLQEDIELPNKTSEKASDQNLPPAFTVDDTLKLKVAFSVDRRRVSVNTLPPTKKLSKASLRNQPQRLKRSNSEPIFSAPRNLHARSSISTQFPVPLTSKITSSNANLTGGRPDSFSTADDIAKNYFPEGIGSSTFIEKNGHVNVSVVLKCFVSFMEHCSVVRISEVVLNICDTLLNMPNIDHQFFFSGILRILLRIYVHLGCPNGCNEGMRTPQADFLRIKAKNIFSQMHKFDGTLLSQILKDYVEDTSCQQLLDGIHAMTMFCQVDKEKEIQRHHHLRSSVTSRRRSSAMEGRLPSYKNHFNESQSGIEGTVIGILLTSLVTKFMKRNDDMSLPENMGLYHDVRMFIAYVQEKHGNPLRKMALSALMARTCSSIQDQFPGAGKSSNGDSKSLNASESASGRFATDAGSVSGSISAATQRDNVSLRRGLFKGKEKISEGLGSLAGPSFNITEEDKPESDVDSSPSTPRQLPSSIDESISNIGSPLLAQHYAKKKGGGGKLQFALNLLKSVKNDNSEEDCWEDATGNQDDSIAGDENSLSAADTKSRISFRSSGQRLSNLRQKQSLSVENGNIHEQEKLGDVQQSVPSFLPPRKLVIIRDVREGAGRFAFLLETCRPGQMPDAPLVAALMELKAPVLSRAVLLLECAHFVHRCNKGDWPEWTRIGGSSAIQSRNVMVGGSGNTASNFAGGTRGGSRKTFLLQRAAGRHFYEWAVQVGLRIQRMLELEEQKPKTVEDKKQTKILDDVEDFLDDGTVNDSTGEACPPALQLMACMLLYQITAFLRETFQSLPRSKVSQKNTTSSTGWEKLMSHRRWSILSNTFQQTGSIHSINDLHPSIPTERRVSYSTADEESSPRGSHDLNTDEQPQIYGEKKGRRLAQGRQRLLKRGSPSAPQGAADSAVRKRESIRIRKPSRSPAGAAVPDVEETNETVSVNFRLIVAPLMLEARSSFIQRRRKTASFRSRLSRKVVQSMRIRNVNESNTGSVDRPSVSSGSTISSDARVSRGASAVIRTRDTLQPNIGTQKYSPTGYFPEGGQISPQPLQPGNLVMTSVPGDQQQIHFSPERRPLMSTAQPLPTALYTIEDEEEDMIRNMPWIKVLISVTKQFDMKKCTHEKYCTKWCFERLYRQCRRLTEALQVVYEDDVVLTPDKRPDQRKSLIESWQNHQENTKQKRTSNPRRESATVRQSGVDRLPLALRGLLIEKLSEIEESKAAKKDGSNSNDAPIDSTELTKKNSPILTYMRCQLLSIAHSPLSGLLKSAIVMSNEHYKSLVAVCWELLIHSDSHVVASSAAMFICCSVKCADECINVMKEDMASSDATCRTEAVRRFFALWRNRFHVWLKMEENAQLIFKVPPPGIDFTLPSPPIGITQVPVVDPPWMPYIKTKVEELSLKEEEQSTSQTIMTMTRTRRKQKQEMVKRAVREAEEKQSELRRQFPLLSSAIVQQAAYEPALFYHQVNVQMQNVDGNGEESDTIPAYSPAQNRQIVMPVAQPFFPSAILSVVPTIIEMFDDVQIDKNGACVGDVCRKIAWTCIVEDSSLFLRNFLEKFTNRTRQEYLMSLLRKLVLTFRTIPSQMAYCLLNYLFGFTMFYVRSPSEGSDKSIAMALSVVWLIVPHVQGLYFKDLKQTLKKEQCDQAIMITANVPSAKKIIIHGPNSTTVGIPTQLPVHEDTQFQSILTDSLEFFNIPEEEVDEYFLVDSKTGILHNPLSYVRDFYFFHRSFYPQLTLVKMNPDEALVKMRTDAFQQKFQETGKVLLTLNALKYSPEAVVPQRIFFLHDEFTHLPSFPRRSVESCFGMYNGPMGYELQSMDAMHKFVWAVLISDMFEKMEKNAFMFGDLHLFINVINGIMIIHCEDVMILRRCMATYLTMSVHFSTLFSSQGFFLIMPTILRCYSQRQTNRLFTQVVEFVCKQFYILHRKPFLLQTFGSVADICDQNNNDLEINAMQIKAKYLFNLLLAMENMNELVDQIDILSLLSYPKPLKALDLCYRDDPNSFLILPDAMASCVTVCAFAPETKRSHQMLLIMQAIIPHFLKNLEDESTKMLNSPTAVKHELGAYTTICVEIKALINSCDALSRGPTRTFDIVTNVSERGKSFIAESPQFFDPPTTVAIEEDGRSGNYTQSQKEKKTTSAGWEATDSGEIQKEIFRGPRDALLTLCAKFIAKASVRLKELTKLAANDHSVRIPELLDHKCHAKLSEIAVSLLKIAPYDLSTMGCSGLQNFFRHILPVVDWSVEANRSVLNVILRRLDKTIAKIAKKPSVRRRANWAAMSSWLSGLYNTLTLYPYIAHLHPLKTITQMCLRLTIGDHCSTEESSSTQAVGCQNPATILNATTPPPVFCNTVLKLTAFLMQALGQMAFPLEYVCSSDGLGPMAERIEAVLCHILIPLFLKAAMPGKEAPQFHMKDISFCLNLIHNAITPPLAKQSLAPMTSTAFSTSLIRESTARGSVSVTDRGGHSATVSTSRIIRDSIVQSILLALKVMILSFQKQLTPHWPKIARIVKDLVAKKAGGAALFSFVEFLINVNLPISLIILPVVHNKLNQRPLTEQEAHWQAELRELISQSNNNISVISDDSIHGFYSLLCKLSQELQLMKEDFSSRMIELPRSHTPTVGDLHSDSGSVGTQSVSTHFSSYRPGTGSDVSRRLSSSTALAKLRSVAGGGQTASAKSSIPLTPLSGPNLGGEGALQDTAILEGSEGDGEHMISGSGISQWSKSPSLPRLHSIQGGRNRASGSGLGMGMFRSVRKKSRYVPQGGEEGLRPVEMREIHRRTKSLNKRLGPRSIVEEPVILAPLETAQTVKTDLTTKLQTPSEPSVGGSDRQRVVSFSTPKKGSSNNDSGSDEEYCITSKQHAI